MVNRVVGKEDLLDAATEYARDLAENCSPTSMGIMKRQLLADSVGDLDTAPTRPRAKRFGSHWRGPTSWKA